MAERLNMAGEGTQGPESEGTPNTPPTDEELLRQPVGERVRHVLGLPESKQAAAIQRLGLEIGGGADTEPASPETDQLPEGLRGPENETNPEKGRWLVDEFLRYRLTMPYEVRYNAENGPRYRWICDEIDKYVSRVIKTRSAVPTFGLHKAYPRPSKSWLKSPTGDNEVEEDFKPPEFGPQPDEIEKLGVAITELRKQYVIEGAEQAGQPAEIIEEALPTDGEGRLIPASHFKARFDNPSTPQEIQEVRDQLDVFFRQAKRNGLLGEVDTVLNETFQEITKEGISPAQAATLLAQSIALANNAAFAEIRDRMLEGADISAFADVGVAYIDFAARAMERHLRGQRQPEPREDEWSIPSSEVASRGEKETYWNTATWPKYYQVTAENEEQFLTAKQTFFSMIRQAGLGKSPDAVYEHIQNFIEAFKGQGGKMVQKEHITNKFLTDNRQELEASLFVFLGNYANEVYNHERRYKAMEAMSLDEGPARWAALYRSRMGGIATFTEIFDMEPLMDIYMNPVGERGELTIQAGHFVQDIIQEEVIERGMGIVLKDYDFREQYLRSDDLEAKIRATREMQEIREKLAAFRTGVRDGNLTLPDNLKEQKIKEGVIEVKKGRIRLAKGYTYNDLLTGREKIRYDALRNNLGRLGLTRSHEEFQALYEGFANGDTHRKNYKRYMRAYPRNKEKLAFANLPEALRRSIDLGRIQDQVSAFRQAIVDGKIIPLPGTKAVDLLSPGDKQIWEEAFAEAEADFAVAFEMQGVLGEKGRRGRGFLYANRNLHLRFFFEQWDKLRTEGLEILNDEEGILIKTTAYDTMWNGFTKDQQRSFEIGFVLFKLRNIDPELLKKGSDPAQFLPEQLRNFYKTLSPEDKADFTDNIPVYLAENFVNWGIFWTKMKYADNASVWEENDGWKEWQDPIARRIREQNLSAKKYEFANFKAKYRRAKIEETRGRLIKELYNNGFQAKLTSDEIGPNGQPKIMTYKRPLGVIDSVTGQFRKFNKDEELGFSREGQKIRLAFDQEGKLVGRVEDGSTIQLEFDPKTGQVILFDRAEDEKDDQGNVINPRKQITYETLTNKTKAKLHEESGVFVEEVEATFEFAVLSDDFRNRYTAHTYWYYQGNNRHPLLDEDVRQAAERIRQGVSRPEDEDILAIALIVVDPTGCRIRKFPDRQQQREITLVASAVLESYQDKQRIKHALHRAFLPSDGFEERMQAGYRNEDWAGMDRFTMGFEEFAAQQPLRLMRRGAAWIADVPFEVDAAPRRWGAHGVGGAVKLLADEVKNIAHQGVVGQFGLTKAFNVLYKAVDMWNAIVGYTDPQTGLHVFGLGEKPTDNNEKLHENFTEAISGDLLNNPSKAIPFLYKFIQAFERLQKVVKIVRVVDSDNDNSAGAVNLEEVDVFLEDGSFNMAIMKDRSIRSNNGTGRNRQYAFLYGEGQGPETGLLRRWIGWYNWLVSKKPGHGGDVYRRERFWNSLLKKSYHDFEADEFRVYKEEDLKRFIKEAEPLEVWLTEKII